MLGNECPEVSLCTEFLKTIKLIGRKLQAARLKIKKKLK